MTERPQTVQEFEARYAARSNVSVDWLHQQGRRGVVCTCGEIGCDGFQMAHRDDRSKGDHCP